MTRGTRIVAVEAADPHDAETSQPAETLAEAPNDTSDDWWDKQATPVRRPWLAIVAAVASLAALAGWSALLFVANRTDIMTGGTFQQWVGWIRDWSVPALLIGVLWLIAMRNSRREAMRFGETARLLGDESARLEERLSNVNRELSLAREFIAAQSRDMESLGRVATERLSQHSDHLSSLIQDNGNRLEAIQTVSAAALDNMETLRGHLPVIASSAKDVTNNIGTAGRTAHAQVEELIAGFNRLNQFGQASERQVKSLSTAVDKALAEFTVQTEQLDAIAQQRFAALAEGGAEFRSQLDAQEVEVLAAIRSRAAALREELDTAHEALNAQEGESLISLRARLSTIRDESAAMSRSLRESEGAAQQSWQQAITRLEEDLATAIAKVSAIDEKAMASARSRLTELSREAEEVDARMLERDRIFAVELDQRRAEFETRHSEFIAQLSDRMEQLDLAIAQRREEQEGQSQRLIAHGEAVTAQLASFTDKLQEVAALGDVAAEKVAASLGTLGSNLTASREALNGTDTAIMQLTDGSVRLLELIQASAAHSSTELPKAMAVSEARLDEIENRVMSLKQQLTEADQRSEAISGHVATSSSGLAEALQRVETLAALVTSEGKQQAAALSEMTVALETIRAESLALAEHSQGELRNAIDALNTSARDAVDGIGALSASAITQIAMKLGDESGAAIEKVMRIKVTEVAGQLEEAAAHASGISREAAIQLRDQLAKVSELTGHLEQRIAHARTRAEEQVDNDFARRVALITESLNSNAIDIARAMDSEVTDMAWSAYLKGDRGIFTRRAVRLLDASEAKAIIQLYEDDRGFRDHVSHYIHDFEAMLRQLLSTRDGHALGVTLLSSDMGKLYVALAQAIERLRN
ncbi:MAG: ATPase [Sphingomonadales bacterium]|nr:ATPase [Sphingomonadales bacterium]